MGVAPENEEMAMMDYDRMSEQSKGKRRMLDD